MDQPRDSLIHVGDLHFWQFVINPFRLLNKRFLGNLNVLFRPTRQYAIEMAEPFAESLAATGIKQVLLTGDFTSTSTDAEFEMARSFVDRLASHGMDITLL
ncbi:MAG: hypothetical protein HY706_00830, partial [Candidatus Hydrogenedentes bacterium]|nr:hypothetical protein [Candidatus Hydrogenedentota bacterium]